MIAAKDARFDELFDVLFPKARADLDFGLYRLLNARRDSLRAFFHEDLPALLDGLALRASADDEIASETASLRRKAEELGVAVEQIPRYAELQADLAQSSSAVLAREALRHLQQFVSRHYVDGDFIPIRRYRSDAYLIPYDGSETTFVYANQEQFFTKSDQQFETFRVRLPDGRRVTCIVTYAEEKLGNNEDNTKQKRRYKLSELTLSDDECVLGFAFVPSEKATQEELISAAVERIQHDTAHTLWFAELFRQADARPWIAGLIERFTKNAEREFFVHKDLGRFLTDELDRYIFTDVFPRANVRDDGTLRRAARVESVLAGIAQALITLLAQFEDLQRDLWTKPRLVTGTAYCMTLDRVPPELVPAVLASSAQRAEWASLYAIAPDEAVSPESHPGLCVDTTHFDRETFAAIERSLSDGERSLDGIVIVSENTAALRTYMRRLAGRVDAIYIDPPFNTGSGSSFRYKNGYRHSSWCCLMEDAVALGGRLLSDDGVIAIAIDDAELSRLQMLADRVLGEQRRLGTQVFVTKHGGRSRDRFLATSHEYALYYAGAGGGAEISFAPLTQEQRAEYKFVDAEGNRYKWRDFMRTGGLSLPRERPHSYYRIFWHSGTGSAIVFADPDKKTVEKAKGRRDLERFLALPGASRRSGLGDEEAYVFLPAGTELPELGEFAVVEPIDSTGTTRVWRKTRLPFITHVANGEIRIAEADGRYKVEIKDPEKRGMRPNSVADEKAFNATAYGTKLLQNMFGESRVFSYPKALGTVKRALEQMVGDDEEAVICDYFAGSGTTGHAVMELNRDGGSRRYILAEMAEYVDEVTIPRLKKAAYSSSWQRGRPAQSDSLSHTFKVVRLEAYEDALENIPLTAAQERDQALELFPSLRRSYVPARLLRADAESSPAFLPASALARGEVKISALDHDGKRRTVTVDLSETLAIWLGMEVARRDRRDGIEVTLGWHNGERTALVVRDPERAGSRRVAQAVKRVAGDDPLGTIIVNGDVSAAALRAEGIDAEVVSVEETLVAGR